MFKLLKLLKGKSLKIEDLPQLGESREIFDFAMTFNGYEHYGSFEQCAEEALKRRRNTMTALRNELFFSARASRETGGFVERYAELRPMFVEMISSD